MGSTFDRDDAPASLHPKSEKNAYKLEYDDKWPKNSLDHLYIEIIDLLPTEDEFDKLSNPFLNGLKNFSSSNEVYCMKCKKMGKITKNGKTKDTYQFTCNNGEKTHYISATQILETLPDEWVLELAEITNQPFRNQLLDWMNKEHLSPEIWEVKGLKNATKRFSQSLSPMKSDSTKIRAVNLGLEEENKRLREENSELLEEVKDLRKSMKALSEEITNLRKYLLENKEQNESRNKDTDPKTTFASITEIHRPVNPKPKLILTPLEVISKDYENRRIDSVRPAFSPLKLIYFEGCQKRSPGIYRNMFKELGMDMRSIRDLTFLTDDILQITTYESAVDQISSTLQSISDQVRRLDNFNPCKAESYTKYGNFTDEQIKNSYFAVMSKSAERLERASETVKALRRSANFLKKVVQNQDASYQPAIQRKKCFVLGSLFDLIKLNEPSPESLNERKDEEMGELENENISQQC